LGIAALAELANVRALPLQLPDDTFSFFATCHVFALPQRVLIFALVFALGVSPALSAPGLGDARAVLFVAP
jgi:hypothetical protein